MGTDDITALTGLLGAIAVAIGALWAIAQYFLERSREERIPLPILVRIARVLLRARFRIAFAGLTCALVAQLPFFFARSTYDASVIVRLERHGTPIDLSVRRFDSGVNAAADEAALVRSGIISDRVAESLIRETLVRRRSYEYVVPIQDSLRKGLLNWPSLRNSLRTSLTADTVDSSFTLFRISVTRRDAGEATWLANTATAEYLAFLNTASASDGHVPDQIVNAVAASSTPFLEVTPAPRRLPFTIFLVVVGFLAGILSGYVHQKTYITEAADLKSFHIPIVGLIPQQTQMRVDAFTVRSVASTRGFVSAVRRLWTRMQTAAEPISRARVIIVTSLLPGDGKSSTSTTLGLVLSHLGHRVLVVDCDLYRPSVHLHYLTPQLPGVTEILLGIANPAECVHRVTRGFKSLSNIRHVVSLDVLVAGQLSDDPASLLTSPTLGSLLEWARSQYEYVIVDTSPLALAPEVSRVARSGDLTLFMVFEGKHRKAELAEALEDLSELPCLAFILNGSTFYGHSFYYSMDDITDYNTEDEH